MMTVGRGWNLGLNWACKGCGKCWMSRRGSSSILWVRSKEPWERDQKQMFHFLGYFSNKVMMLATVKTRQRQENTKPPSIPPKSTDYYSICTGVKTVLDLSVCFCLGAMLNCAQGLLQVGLSGPDVVTAIKPSPICTMKAPTIPVGYFCTDLWKQKTAIGPVRSTAG